MNFQNQTSKLFLLKMIVLSLMCVLSYLSFVCISVYANVYFKTTIIKKKKIIIAGVPWSQVLPGFLDTAPPSVCVPDVIGVLAVWIPKKTCLESSPYYGANRKVFRTNLSQNCSGRSQPLSRRVLEEDRLSLYGWGDWSKINLFLSVRVLSYSLFVCTISAYANVYFTTTIIKQNMKIILFAGVPLTLPYYRTSICMRS